MTALIPTPSLRRAGQHVTLALLGAAALAGVLLLGLLATSASAASTFQVTVDGRALTYTLPGSSAVTIRLTPSGSTADAWLTSASPSGLTRKLEASTVPVVAPTGTQPTIAVDPAKAYQSMDGFGGAMTDSAASVISGSPKRDEIMKALFEGSGARFTVTRLPIGASDFAASASFKSYADVPAGGTDPLANFSVAHDEPYIIPLLKQALGLSPQMKIIAAPWSAPSWMKIGGTFRGTCEGSSNYLKDTIYPTYARYLVKFVDAYKAKGLPTYMVSLQNEPHNCNSTYPTMSMEPGDQAHLADELRPALDSAGLGGVKLMAWDHNWTEGGVDTTYPQQALKCANGTSNSVIDAVGYHDYGGEDRLDEVQTKFHNDCAGKDIYFTEATGFAAASNTAANLVFVFRNTLIGPTRNWSRGSMYWNLALDQNHGPHQGGCGDCTGMVTVKSDGTYDLNETYYYWKHFSKFVDPGAVRIASTEPTDGSLLTVAFRNPDGAIVLVAMNPGGPEAVTPPVTTPPPPCTNPFAVLFGGCPTTPPPPPPPPPATAPPPPPPPAATPPPPPAPVCTGNPFAWLFGGC